MCGCTMEQISTAWMFGSIKRKVIHSRPLKGVSIQAGRTKLGDIKNYSCIF